MPADRYEGADPHPLTTGGSWRRDRASRPVSQTKSPASSSSPRTPRPMTALRWPSSGASATRQRWASGSRGKCASRSGDRNDGGQLLSRQEAIVQRRPLRTRRPADAVLLTLPVEAFGPAGRGQVPNYLLCESRGLLARSHRVVLLRTLHAPTLIVSGHDPAIRTAWLHEAQRFSS